REYQQPSTPGEGPEAQPGPRRLADDHDPPPIAAEGNRRPMGGRTAHAAIRMSHPDGLVPREHSEAKVSIPGTPRANCPGAIPGRGVRGGWRPGAVIPTGGDPPRAGSTPRPENASRGPGFVGSAGTGSRFRATLNLQSPDVRGRPAMPRQNELAPRPPRF